MTVTMSTYKQLKIAHINFLTTNIDPEIRGVGRLMMTKVEEFITKTRTHFIELQPLHDVIGFYTKLGYSKCLEPSGLYCKYLPIYSELQEKYPTIVDEYAAHLDLKREQEEEKANALQESELTEILEQLTPEEIELYHIKQEKDDSTAITVLILYDHENGGSIDEVKKFLTTSGGKTRKKLIKRIKHNNKWTIQTYRKNLPLNYPK